MKNKNTFFFKVASAVFFTVGTIFLMFQEMLNSGIILMIIGSLVALYSLSSTRSFHFEESFLFVATFLSLVILSFIFMIGYSKNLVIISASFYALNFLIQVNYLTRKKVKIVKSIKKNEINIKEAIAELKKEIKKEKELTLSLEKETDYFYTDRGKSFHVAGCLTLARTKLESLKKIKSRDTLLGKGYKSCKACNS